MTAAANESGTAVQTRGSVISGPRARLVDAWTSIMNALRVAAARTPHAMVLVCIISSAFLQISSLRERFSLSGLFVALLLVGGPLSSYAFYMEVKRSSRPALSALMLAVAAFFAMMSLAIAELGAPISAALTRNISMPAEASSAGATARDPAGASPAAAATGQNPAAAGAKVPLADPRTASAASAIPDQNAVNGDVKAPDRPNAITAPPYSLYDMLSLLGMVATVSLIALGALVPEETKMLESRREDRLLLQEAFGDFVAKIHAFHGKPGSTDCALAVRHAANRLILRFAPSEYSATAKARVRELLASLRLSRAIEGGYTEPGGLPPLTAVIDRVEAIAELIEDQ